MSEIEKVAKAIEDALFRETYERFEAEDYVAMARAALEALREPTEAMIDAADISVIYNASLDVVGTPETVWRAMIGAILTPSQDGDAK